MTIKKYRGKTKEEAILAAKKELGNDAEIMNVEEKKSGGFLGLGKKVTVEITAMVDRDIDPGDTLKGVGAPEPKKPEESLSPNSAISTYSNFSAVADQDIKMTYDNKSKDEAEELEETKRQFAELSKIFRENERKVDNTKPSRSTDVESQSKVQTDNTPGEYVGTNSTPVRKEVVNDRTTNDNKQDDVIPSSTGDNHKFVKTLYTTLLENDVDEKYINQLLFDMEKVFKNGNNVNYLISNVYQKMILKLGQPQTATISLAKKGPKVVFFIGSTGVGKTTTIAKLASEFKIEKKKEVALVTIDTYRLKATDQLGEYASIMKIPMSVIYEPNELTEKVRKLQSYDLILVDTSGFSHKNNDMRENVVELVNNLDEKFEKDVYLVLSSTTKYKDLKEIIDSYKEFTDFNMIFTKLDETTSLGNILNCRLYSGNNLSYVTNGQNVPNDISVLDTQRLVKQLLGGN